MKQITKMKAANSFAIAAGLSLGSPINGTASQMYTAAKQYKNEQIQQRFHNSAHNLPPLDGGGINGAEMRISD